MRRGVEWRGAAWYSMPLSRAPHVAPTHSIDVRASTTGCLMPTQSRPVPLRSRARSTRSRATRLKGLWIFTQAHGQQGHIWGHNVVKRVRTALRASSRATTDTHMMTTRHVQLHDFQLWANSSAAIGLLSACSTGYTTLCIQSASTSISQGHRTF